MIINNIFTYESFGSVGPFEPPLPKSIVSEVRQPYVNTRLKWPKSRSSHTYHSVLANHGR